MSGWLVCLDAGPAVTVQDLGRPGYGHLGLAASGAMDDETRHLANRLVGNDEDAALLELGLRGGRFRLEGTERAVALIGAGPEMLRVDGIAVPPFTSAACPEGGVVTVGVLRRGVWACLALAGGIALPPVLGSRSTHARARIGGIAGRRLQPADRLPLGEPGLWSGGLSAPPGDGPAEDEPIRVVAGPQEEQLGPAACASFYDQRWKVAPASDRMAYRLEGSPLAHAGGFNIVSDAILPGSIQVPGNGQPLVMMADHQTTGGYPKIATIISADLARMAQRPPGSMVRFRAVELDEADAARRARRQALTRRLAGIRPADRRHDLATERLLALNLVDGVIDATDGTGS